MTFALLETIRVPALVLVGGADLLSPPALMRLLAAHISNCQFATVPEAGHAALWEQPEVWNRLVLEFIGQHEESSASPKACWWAMRSSCETSGAG